MGWYEIIMRSYYKMINHQWERYKCLEFPKGNYKYINNEIYFCQYLYSDGFGCCFNAHGLYCSVNVEKTYYWMSCKLK